MSAKFTKLQEVDLTLEDPVVEENGTLDIESPVDDSVVELNLAEDPVFVPKWKFWNKPFSFKYDLTAATNRHLNQSRVCKRCRCSVNSWKAIIITLLVFVAAVLISVIISRVVREPPGEVPTTVPSQFEGNGEPKNILL